MKPTFRVHFSSEHPNRPGLWLSRRQNYIAVLNVDASDIERDQRQEGSWLNGEWGAALELVDRDLVPLDKRKVREYFDRLISAAHEAKNAPVVDALQNVREQLLGNRLELPAEPGPEPEHIDEI